MGRPKTERRQLTAEEKRQAQGLMETYMPLAKQVARKCWCKYDLQEGFVFSDVLEIAYLALCEAATVYVLEYDLPKERERSYLAQAIEHDIVDYIRKKERILSLEREVEECEHPLGDVEAGEYVPIWDALKEFAASLPADERLVFETAVRDILANQLPPLEEFAKNVGMSRSKLHEVRRSLREKLMVWAKDEYAA